MKAMHINRKLLPMKIHYFLYSGSTVSIISFGTTYAKQLGYSKVTVGYIMTCLFILSMLTKPVVGAICDKFSVKRFMFLAFILLSGISSAFVMLVPRMDLKTSAELHCNTTLAAIKINSDDNRKKLSVCDRRRLLRIHGDKLADCKLNCNDYDHKVFEMFTLRNISQYQTLENRTNENVNHIINSEIKKNNLSVHLQLDGSNTENFSSIDFLIKFVNINNTLFILPLCRRPIKTTCQLNCTSPTIMHLASVPKSQKTIFSTTEFWEFLILLCLFWISQSTIWTLQDPICFDLLDDKHSQFGKQRCWAAVGWGLVSILGGLLVDYFSHDEVYKNYKPIAYLIIVFMILNFVVASDIQVNEFKASQDTFQNVFNLFTKLNVLSFFLWILLMAINSSMSMSYLFWYLEDLASENECGQLAYMKTLQGFSQGIQSFGGELPIFFCSGWIIRKIGHKHCMPLVLLAFSIRFYIYSIMTNPVWALLIEIPNGMMYALGRAVMYSYARMISPPSTQHTVLGLVGVFDCIGSSLGGVLAGHIYDMYGGVWLFQLFTYGSAMMCALQIIYNLFDKTNMKKTYG